MRSEALRAKLAVARQVVDMLVTHEERLAARQAANVRDHMHELRCQVHGDGRVLHVDRREGSRVVGGP